jgi:mycothiol synthase
MPPPESAPLPDGVHLRTVQPTDTAALCRLLETGTFGSWPTQRLDALFDHEIDRLSPRHVHLATHGNVLVGHCCLMVRDEPEGTVGKLGWVVAHPDFRGQGIGRAVCVAALQSAHQLGLGTVILNTEDFRIAAVRLYLELGFAPVLGDSDATDRFWADLTRTPPQTNQT